MFVLKAYTVLICDFRPGRCHMSTGDNFAYYYTVKIMILSRYRYRPVTVPLPSRYHPVTILGYRYPPSINVTAPLPHRPSPSLTVPHRPSPSITVPHLFLTFFDY